MENYEQKYNQALERAKILHTNNTMPPCNNLREIMEELFPELKESEDERIRKEIIDFLELPHPQFVGKRDHEKWIAWLEKQSEKKPAVWSEEDEEMFCSLKKLLNEASCYSCTEGSDKILNWLESLNPKKHWKPSEEQMQALFEAKLASINNREYFLGLLYEDLKKL